MRFSLSEIQPPIPLRKILLTIIFLVPLAIYKGTYNQVLIKLSLTQVLLLSSFILCIGRYSLARLKLIRTPLNLPILIFLSLALLSLAASKYKWASVAEVYRLLTYLLLYFVTVSTVRDKNSLNMVTFVWLLSTGLACLYGLYQHSFEGMSPIRSSFGNANFFAAYLVLVLPLALALLINNIFPMLRKNWSSHRFKETPMAFVKIGLRILALAILLGIMILSLSLASSRGAWLGLTIGLISFGWLSCLRVSTRRSKRIVPALLLALLIIFSISTPSLLKKKPVKEELETGTLGLRFLIWEGTLRMIASNPFIGTGIGTFYIAYPEYRLPEYFKNPHAVDATAHAHNEFLELGGEMGILGLGAFLWILVVCLRQAVTLVRVTEDKRRRNLVIGLISGVAGLIVTNLVGVNLRFPSSAIFFWLTLGLVIGQLPPSSYKKIAFGDNFQGGFPLKLPSRLRREASKGDSPRPDRGEGLTYSYRLAAVLFGLSLVASIWVGWQIVAKPFLANVHFQNGINYRKVGNWERTISEYKRAIEFDPYFVKVYYRLGFAYVAKGELDKAISAYQKVMSLAPNFARIHNNLATLYLRKGEKDEAVKSLERALRLNPY